MDLTVLQTRLSTSMSTKKKGSTLKAVPKSLSKDINKVSKVVQSSDNKTQIEESNTNQKLP